MFASHTRNIYCHGSHRILPMKTSAASSDLGLAVLPKEGVAPGANESRNHMLVPSNGSKKCTSNRMDSNCVANCTNGEEVLSECLKERHCVPTAVPNFLITCLPKVMNGGRGYAILTSYSPHRSRLYLFPSTVLTGQLASFTRNGCRVAQLSLNASSSMAWRMTLLPCLDSHCLASCTSGLEAWMRPTHLMAGPTSIYQVIVGCLYWSASHPAYGQQTK